MVFSTVSFDCAASVLTLLISLSDFVIILPQALDLLLYTQHGFCHKDRWENITFGPSHFRSLSCTAAS